MVDSQPERFVVKGFHGTVTACTLPAWLPEPQVRKMNSYFGAELRAQLVNLISRPDLLRKRVPSSGSRGASIDSLDELGPRLKNVLPSFKRGLGPPEGPDSDSDD